eukprot:TRINITY_DN65737_c3_g3_i1.p1 TRINITY_DN65737_c3_g3~~TRINITY_DN65737_c3_g3_i1.p1  ORF type:complete len:762 (+),score=338.30 TRINITY_DN65737_c3_g3_i1:304-2286(+)
MGGNCDQVDASFEFDGDDALALMHNRVLVDVIGQAKHGAAGVAWSVAGTVDATRDHTLHRVATVTQGREYWPGVNTVNRTATSEWTVLAADTVTNLGTHTVTGLSCPSTLLKLTCGTRGTSNVLVGGATGTELQVECPSTCIYHYGPVFGSQNTGFSTSSYVCKAAAGIVNVTSLSGDLSTPDPRQINAPSTTAFITAGGIADTLFTHSSALDVLVVVDGSSSVSAGDFTSQLTFVNQLFNTLDIQPDGRRVRVAVVQYANAAASVQLTTLTKSTITTTVSAITKQNGNRRADLGLTSVLTELTANGRVFDPKFALLLTLGSWSGSTQAANVAAADSVKALGAYVVVLGVTGSLDDAQNRLLATSNEHYLQVAAVAQLNTAIASLQTLFIQSQQCWHHQKYISGRTLLTYTVGSTSSGATVTSGALSDTTCVPALTLSTGQNSFTLAKRTTVTCTNSCSNKGNCDPRTGTCQCADGFSGADCSTIACAEKCFNGGTCNTATGTCSCTGIFYGPNCLFRTCDTYNNCSAHGECDPHSGTCTCFPPYFGANCTQQSCYQDCNGHGDCNTEFGNCTCYDGFVGQYCELISCPDNCSGGNFGTCDFSTGKCTCAAGTITSLVDGTCEYGVCPNDCSGHGDCDARNRVCTCHAGWLGTDCSLQIT